MSDDTRTDTHRQTDRQTQTDFIICPIAICYSYGVDNNVKENRVRKTWKNQEFYFAKFVNIQFHCMIG